MTGVRARAQGQQDAVDCPGRCARARRLRGPAPQNTVHLENLDIVHLYSVNIVTLTVHLGTLTVHLDTRMDTRVVAQGQEDAGDCPGRRARARRLRGPAPTPSFSSSLLLSSLELSDTQVYGPQIRARLGTASHFCEGVVLKLRTHSYAERIWHK